jgi:predicted house-cleaning noncanonical NTP pyrophosphatase (MazG superfamily)
MKFEDFEKELIHWCHHTFPAATKKSIIAHLKKEIEELENDDTPEELADCLMLILDYASRSNWNVVLEAKKKLEICKARSWHPPDE